MATASITRAAEPGRGGDFGPHLLAEWTKLRSVRSTKWSLLALAVLTIGFNALITAITIHNWGSVSAADKASYRADPTGFLGAALNFAAVPIGILGVMVMAGEYSTGVIRASVLAVPKRTPMLAAKVVVFTLTALVVGELIAFPSFWIAQAIIGNHLPLTLSDHHTLRAVFGVGLFISGIGLLGVAIGGIVRHTGAAITLLVAFGMIFNNLAGLIPGSLGRHVESYLPYRAGMTIMSRAQPKGLDVGPWQGFLVLCLWCGVLLAIAAYLLKRRDV